MYKYAHYLDQLDLEMGFAKGSDVRMVVEQILRNIFKTLRGMKIPRQVGGVLYSSDKELFKQYRPESVTGQTEPIIRNCWPVSDIFVRKRLMRVQYHDAMAYYGTDKPDLRIPIAVCISMLNSLFHAKLMESDPAH